MSFRDPGDFGPRKPGGLLRRNAVESEAAPLPPPRGAPSCFFGRRTREWPSDLAHGFLPSRESHSAAQKKNPELESGDSPSAPGVWTPPPVMPALAVPDVHVWRIDLDAGSLEPAERNLSSDELARAGRFKFPRDREHFVAARAALRRILAGYLGAAAEALRFRYGAQGKPALEGLSVRDGLDFNGQARIG